MKKKINLGIIQIILGGALIIFIIMVPFIVENIDENNMIETSYKTKKVDFSLDSDVEDIEMVNRIHQANNSMYLETNQENLFIQEADIYNSEEYKNSIKDMDKIFEISSILDTSTTFNNCIVLNPTSGETEGYASIIFFSEDNNAEKVEIVYDVKMKKILGFTIFSDKLINISENQKKKMLDSFIEYLNLKIVGDWKYDGDAFISGKAHLKMGCNLTEKSIQVYIGIDKGYIIN